jgi:hypothetical protein
MAAMSRFQARVGSWIVAALVAAIPAQAMTVVEFDKMPIKIRVPTYSYL